MNVAANITIFCPYQKKVNSSGTIAKQFNGQAPAWGFHDFITIADLIEGEKKFTEREKNINYIDVEAELRPTFKVMGRVTLRFFTPEEWETHNKTIIEKPQLYLYLKNLNFVADHVYPARPSKMSTPQSMADKMLEQAESDLGAIEFIVGEGAVSVYVNHSIIAARVGVPIVHLGLAESKEKKVYLPHVSEDLFRQFVKFLATHEMDDACLSKHALALLTLADLYHVDDLRYICEHYLCWATQVSVDQSVRFQTEVLVCSNSKHTNPFLDTELSGVCRYFQDP
jgi:hypothetical protein